MKKLGDQWIEMIDGQEHMVKAVACKDRLPCHGCDFGYFDKDDNGIRVHTCSCTFHCDDSGQYIIKDLGILKDGRLPCPFCDEYPESFNKGNEYTKKRCSVMKCKKCNYELTVCAIYKTIEWCKEKVLYNWNRRA